MSDHLFPRIDEDMGQNMNADNEPGIKDYDDDGDTSVDEWFNTDDDEDGVLLWGYNEDPLDGIDNDGDGNVDEDLNEDANSDNQKPNVCAQPNIRKVGRHKNTQQNTYDTKRGKYERNLESLSLKAKINIFETMMQEPGKKTQNRTGKNNGRNNLQRSKTQQ